MEKTVSNRGIKIIYWAVSVGFIMLAAWLYCKEGPYIKVMNMSIVPEKGRVQAEILTDGKNQKVSVGDRQTKLYVDRRYEGEKVRLLIYGECDEERTDAVTIKAVTDSHDKWEEWSYKILAGTEEGDIEFKGAENRERKLYPLMSVVVTTIMGFMWFRGEKSSLLKGLENYCNKLIEKLEQEPGMEKCCAEGKRLFAVYESQNVIMHLLLGWVWMFLAFWMIHGITHETVLLNGAFGCKFVLGVVGLAVLKFWGEMRWGSLNRAILVEDCRPVTAAVAYLLMGSYGIERKWSRFLLYHNGASGLYRSGHCREALEISNMAWKSLSKRPGDYIVYVHSSLKYQCLKVLEETEAAREELSNMEALQKKNPGWRRRKDIQRFLGIQDICQRIETGEIEQAEKSASAILKQWEGGYYRLPVLSLMAELKEFLGKEEEAAELREEILTFSPENKEVRQVMREGRLRYRQKGPKVWDAGLLAVCGICAGGIAVCLFMM